MRRNHYMIVKGGSKGQAIGLYIERRRFLGLSRKWEMVPQFFETVQGALNHISRTDEYGYVRVLVANGWSIQRELLNQRTSWNNKY